jgi:hypothetical protein
MSYFVDVIPIIVAIRAIAKITPKLVVFLFNKFLKKIKLIKGSARRSFLCLATDSSFDSICFYTVFYVPVVSGFKLLILDSIEVNLSIAASRKP